MAGMTYHRLKLNGDEVWYDNAMGDRSEGAMEEGVKHCSNFVLFLTGDGTPSEGVPPVASSQ